MRIKYFMLIMLQTFLFCLAGFTMSCTKPSERSVMNNNDTLMNKGDSTNTDSTNADSTSHADTTFDNETYTWLALGDSYTIGESVIEDERFPAQTVSLLKNK